MNRFVSFVVIAVLLIVSAGYFPVNQLQQYHVRQQVKQKLKEGFPEKQLEIIMFSDAANVDWVKKGKEFWLNGKLYDVVRSERDGNSIKYTCYDDTEEKALKIKLIRSSKKQSESKNTPIRHGYNKLLDTLRQALANSTELPDFYSIDAVECYFEINQSLHHTYLEITSPPPDLG